MKINRFKLNILISLIFFLIISVLSIYTTKFFLKSSFSTLYLKQLFFYLIGFIIMFLITYKGFNLLKKYHFLIYIGLNILLLALLIFGIDINGSKCWLFIGPFSFQPSELMKISLIITLASVIVKDKNKPKTMKQEFILLVKLVFLTFIPSILTFLEPDTGVVIIYLLILITFIFFLNINYRWYLFFFLGLLLLSGIVVSLYFFKKDFILKLLANNLFYRFDRIINWTSNSGYQLENSLIAIGASGFLGFGFNQNKVYFPEPQTDFIFATFASNFGFLGILFLFSIIVIFDSTILKISLKKCKLFDKYIIIGIFIMLFYGQVQNIAMTIGLLPITGIPLPFISYGGSSLLSYLLVIGFILNINQERLKYRN